MSRIGKKPVTVPKEVKIEVKDGFVLVEGPKGKLTRKLSDRISLEIKDGILLVKRVADTKLDRSMHGLFRALIVNMIKGVTEGYTKELEIIGHARVILAAADVFGNGIVEGLDADFELQRARGKFGDDFAQGFGQTIGNHFEMDE